MPKVGQRWTDSKALFSYERLNTPNVCCRGEILLPFGMERKCTNIYGCFGKGNSGRSNVDHKNANGLLLFPYFQMISELILPCSGFYAWPFLSSFEFHMGLTFVAINICFLPRPCYFIKYFYTEQSMQQILSLFVKRPLLPHIKTEILCCN